MEDVGICHGPLVYFTAIWYILWMLGIFCGNLVYFFAFWYVLPCKIWQPCSQTVENGWSDMWDDRVFESPPSFAAVSLVVFRNKALTAKKYSKITINR
jgi:disulfide bond formation protein DsbB